jgi:hypothetical protein
MGLARDAHDNSGGATAGVWCHPFGKVQLADAAIVPGEVSGNAYRTDVAQSGLYDPYQDRTAPVVDEYLQSRPPESWLDGLERCYVLPLAETLGTNTWRQGDFF